MFLYVYYQLLLSTLVHNSHVVSVMGNEVKNTNEPDSQSVTDTSC